MMEKGIGHRLQWLIERRHSSRGRYDPERAVTEAELARLVAAARWAPTAHNMQNFELVAVDDRRVLAALGDLRVPISPAFVVEQYPLLSWTPEELARRKVGILGTMFPPSWRTGDPARVPADEARPLAHVIAGAPLVLVVLFDPTKRAPASEGDVLGQISLGCVLENIWLAAQAAGLELQVLSTFAAEPVAPEVLRVLGVPPPWRIAYALRLGHEVQREPQLRVRRDAEAFVHRNRFGGRGAQ